MEKKSETLGGENGKHPKMAQHLHEEKWESEKKTHICGRQKRNGAKFKKANKHLKRKKHVWKLTKFPQKILRSVFAPIFAMCCVDLGQAKGKFTEI